MRTIALFAVLALAPSASFARDVTVTLVVYSDPVGATVYANGGEQRMGYSPMKLKFKFPSSRWSTTSGCRTVQAIKVRWASGAEASVEHVTLCPESGKSQQLTFLRPKEIPGVEMDAAFALEIERGIAAQEAAVEAVIIPPVGTPVTCHSQVIGNQVFTNCS